MEKEYYSDLQPSNASTPEKAMQRIRFAPEEWVYVFGGKRSKMFQGIQNRVTIHNKYIGDFKNATIVHNHTSGTSFSKEDIRTIIGADVERSILVTADAVFEVQRPKGGWPKNLLGEGFESHWDICLSQIEDLFMKLISKNEITLHESEVVKMHYIWSLFFKLNDIRYERKYQEKD